MKNFSLLLSFFLLCCSASAQWSAVGPFGGLIRSAATINGKLLVGTNSGIYRSSDGGQSYQSWSQGLPAGDIIDLYQDGANLFACIFEKGIYRSSDEGISWTLVLPGRYLRQDGFGQSRIQKVGAYVMVRNYDDFNDSLFFSNDAGATWIRRAVSGSLFNNIYAFGNSLFGYGNANVFGPQAGLYRSDDLAQTWTFSGTGMPAAQYVGHMTQFQDTLYVLDKHIFRSTNGGSNWTQVTSDTLLTVGGAYAYAPGWFLKAGNTIFSQNGGNFNVKVATWKPGQSRWQDSYSGLPTQGSTLGLYSHGSKVYLGRYEGILYETSGAGQPWTTASLQGVNAIVHNGLFAQENEALSTTATEVRKGNDAGSTWTLSNPANISNEVRLFNITRVGSNYLMGVENVFGVLDIYQASSPSGPWTAKGIYDIAPNANLLPKGDSMVIYGSLGGTPACFITNSQGVEISDFDNGLFGFSFDDGLPSMISHKGDLYCVITGFQNNFSKIRKFNLPSGTFWEQVAEKIDGQFFGATAIGSFEDKLYLGMIGGGVKVSDNDGSTWTDLSSGIGSARVRQFLVADNFLLAATDKGVFRLKSGETNWADLTYNLPVSELRKLALTPQHLWALADGGGVWRLNREGQVAVAPEVQALPFSLSPNPAAHTLSLGLSASREESQWHILDMQGRMLMEGRTAAGQDVQALDIHHLPAGVYVCRVVQGDRFAVKHFVKE